MTENIAVLLLTHVNYRSGKVYDMKTITAKAHTLGIVVIWDLSHSIGVVRLFHLKIATLILQSDVHINT